MKKIGIITIPRADNYGSVLQAYAIQQFIDEIEKDNELIDYVAPFLIGRYKLWSINKSNVKVLIKSVVRNCLTYNAKKIKRKKFEEFRKLMHFSQNTIYSSNQIDKYEYYITGSDQIWNTRITNSNDVFFLDFVKSNERKIAFAVSMGFCDRTDKEIFFYKKMLNSFKWIGVREINDVEFAKQCSENAYVDYIVDPTLLISEEKWKSFINKSLIDGDYILVYLFGTSNELLEKTQKLANDKGLPVYIISDEWRKVDTYGFINLSGIGPIDFINLIANATYVVTNSFHGTAFSIIFRKQFIVFPYHGTENRIISLLSIFDLENAIYYSNNNCELDYSELEDKLGKEREKARRFIIEAIGD